MNNSDLFDRKLCKKTALSQLKGNWKVPVLVSLIFLALLFLLNIGSIIDSTRNSTFNYTNDGHSFYFNFDASPAQLSTTDYIEMGVSILTFLITGIFAIAFAKFFLDLSNGVKPTFDEFFKNLELWAKGVLEMLWSSLFIFLWSLLFFVPGIIKSIAYSQAFFILAEYPDVSVTQALKISQKITKGYKSDLFVLDLSFIGWELLCFLTAGIGFIWLLPYMQTTKANAYKFLMKNAFEKNRVTYEELHKNFESASSYEKTGETENSEQSKNFWGNPKDAINNDDIKVEEKSEENSEN